jgi:hypothetical protein
MNTVQTVQSAVLNATPKTMEEMQAEIERLKSENTRIREEKVATARVSCKVSEKRALSVYGLGRWPITLYKEQWRVLLAHSEKIHAFIKANDHLLKAKGEE